MPDDAPVIGPAKGVGMEDARDGGLLHMQAKAAPR
jgi:hypothetical protein